MIGLDKHMGELYRLQIDTCPLIDDTHLLQSHSTSINTIFPRNSLCHFRLCHVSNKNLSHITLLCPSISFDNKVTCDIFHLARQKKFPFSHSPSIATFKFEMPHLDIYLDIYEDLYLYP